MGLIIAAVGPCASLRPPRAVEHAAMRDSDATTSRRPRPVADAPIAPFARGTGLAKAWLLELLDALPLERAGRLPAAQLAQEAPALCAALCRALTDDAALDAFAPGGADAVLASRVLALAGGGDAGGTALAAEALRRVTWAALRDELHRPEPRLVADLADRVAHVCGIVAHAALVAGSAAVAASVAVPDGVVSLQDTRAARTEPGTWEGALRRRLERHARDGEPFALLLAELDGFDVLLAAHEAQELAAAVHAVERSLSDLLEPGDVLSREDAGRYWVTLGNADATIARDLATRIATEITANVALSGAGLTLSAGVAACPQDGADLQALTARAEEGLFLARAAGIPVTG